MSVTASTPIDLSSVVESQQPLEAVLLITRTGAQLGAWTRNSVPIDVLSVMAATLVGSIETLMTALGASSPREVSLMIDGRRVFVSKVNAQVVLVIVAAGGMTEVALRAAMRQIVKSLPPFTWSQRSPFSRGLRIFNFFLGPWPRVLVWFERNAWTAARTATGDIPMRIGTVGSGSASGTPCPAWSPITVITAVSTFPDVSIARA